MAADAAILMVKHHFVAENCLLPFAWRCWPCSARIRGRQVQQQQRAAACANTNHVAGVFVASILTGASELAWLELQWH